MARNRLTLVPTPEEILIGYFVTAPLDKVQDTLSHVSTIVASRVRLASVAPVAAAKPARVRVRKPAAAAVASGETTTPAQAADAAPKRKRGRPAKVTAPASDATTGDASIPTDAPLPDPGNEPLGEDQ